MCAPPVNRKCYINYYILALQPSAMLKKLPSTFIENKAKYIHVKQYISFYLSFFLARLQLANEENEGKSRVGHSTYTGRSVSIQIIKFTSI